MTPSCPFYFLIFGFCFHPGFCAHCLFHHPMHIYWGGGGSDLVTWKPSSYPVGSKVCPSGILPSPFLKTASVRVPWHLTRLSVLFPTKGGTGSHFTVSNFLKFGVSFCRPFQLQHTAPSLFLTPAVFPWLNLSPAPC